MILKGIKICRKFIELKRIVKSMQRIVMMTNLKETLMILRIKPYWQVLYCNEMCALSLHHIKCVPSVLFQVNNQHKAWPVLKWNLLPRLSISNATWNMSIWWYSCFFFFFKLSFSCITFILQRVRVRLNYHFKLNGVGFSKLK